MLPPVVLQLLQVLTLLIFSPLVTGVISRAEALLQTIPAGTLLPDCIRYAAVAGRDVRMDDSQAVCRHDTCAQHTADRCERHGGQRRVSVRGHNSTFVVLLASLSWI